MGKYIKSMQLHLLFIEKYITIVPISPSSTFGEEVSKWQHKEGVETQYGIREGPMMMRKEGALLVKLSLEGKLQYSEKSMEWK